MKKRYLYPLLFGIPGFFVSALITVILFGAVAGVLWIFIFGDNPWPGPAETLLSILLGSVFLILWITSIAVGYLVGKRLENHPALDWSHVLISGGLTLVFILFIVLQRWSVGNLGPKSDTVLCSEFCAQHGYSGSGMQPETSFHRMCSCYDSSGNEVMTVPLDIIATDVPR